MLLWLSGTQNTKWSPNENYGRELMELFTLGAGRGYTERDVREQARALTGFENDWKRGVGVVQLPLREGPPRCGHQAHLRQDGRLQLAGLRPALPPPQEPPVLLRRQALAVLHSDDARRGHAALAREPLPQGLPDPARGRCDPSPPRAPHRPADGQAACGLHRRPAAGARPRRRHAGVGVALERVRAAPVHAAERLGLGRRALARHRHLPRPLGGRELRDPAVRAHRQAVGGAAGRATGPRRRSARLLGQPDDPPGHAGRLSSRFATKAMSDADAEWKKTGYRFLVANGLRQLIAVSPDLQTS